MGEEWYHHERREEEWNRAMKPLCLELPKEWPWGMTLCQKYLGSRDLGWTIARRNGWFSGAPPGAGGNGPSRLVIPCLDSTEPLNRFYQTRATESWDLPRYDGPRKVRRGGALAVLAPMPEDLPLPGARTPKSWSAPQRVIVEGPMCALAAAMEGYPSCALLGGSPPEAVFNSLWIYLLATAQTVLLIPDRDQPNLMVKTMLRLVEWSAQNRLRLPRLLVQTPHEAKDLADLPKEKRSVWLERAFASG